MAQQKKKTTTTKKKTTGSSRSSSSGKRTAKKNQKRPIRREVAGAILLVLALCLGFSYFQSGAWLLDQPAKLCRSLFGWGYYLVAPALLLGSYILLFHRGRNVASCLSARRCCRSCSARSCTSPSAKRSMLTWMAS